MIVIVFPQLYGVHGIARYIQSFLAAVNHTDGRIVVLTGQSDDRQLQVPSNVEFVHVPLPPGRLGLVRWSLAARRWLSEAARRERISLVNLHIPPLLPGLFLPTVAPTVVTAHTTYLGMSGRFYRPRQFRSQWNPASVWIKMMFERYIFKRSDAILTLTEQGRQEVEAYGFSGAINIVPNGVALEVFTPDSTVKKTYDVLFAGRIERRKGSRSMVEVCRGLVSENPGIRISIVGYGDDFDYVAEQLAPLAANIDLAGKLPFEHMLEKYRSSRIYASTSYYEGLPGTCLEAMAVGLPVVVWDYLFYRDLVMDGRNGHLVAPNDTRSFISKISEILSAPPKLVDMGKEARKSVETAYSWGSISAEIMRAFHKMTER